MTLFVDHLRKWAPFIGVMLSIVIATSTTAQNTGKTGTRTPPAVGLTSGTRVVTLYDTISVDKDLTEGPNRVVGHKYHTTDIQKAIDLVEPGGTITIFPFGSATGSRPHTSVYQESLTVNKDNITIKTETGPYWKIIVDSLTAPCLTYTSGGTLVVSDLTFFSNVGNGQRCISITGTGTMGLKNVVVSRDNQPPKFGVGIGIGAGGNVIFSGINRIERFDTGISAEPGPPDLTLTHLTIKDNNWGLKLYGGPSITNKQYIRGGTFVENNVGVATMTMPGTSAYTHNIEILGSTFSGKIQATTHKRSGTGISTTSSVFGGTLTIGGAGTTGKVSFTDLGTGIAYPGGLSNYRASATIRNSLFKDNTVAFDLTRASRGTSFNLHNNATFEGGETVLVVQGGGPSIDLYNRNRVKNLVMAGDMPAIIIKPGFDNALTADLSGDFRLNKRNEIVGFYRPFHIRVDSSKHCASLADLENFLQTFKMEDQPLFELFTKKRKKKKLYLEICNLKKHR